MEYKKIEVPVLPEEFIYYVTSKSEIIEHKVSSIKISKTDIFIEIHGNFDSGEEVVFSSKQIGKEIFLDKNDAEKSLVMNNGR